MVELCARCNVNGEEVRLFDAIYEGRISNLCERCSIIENIPIIKKPAASQLKESEKGIVKVYDRMKRLAGIPDSKPDETFFMEDKLNELNENPSLEVPERERLKLIDHFHWEIMKNRRRKGLSPKQLAEILGESEIVIEMIEKEKLPEDAENLIRKLEQFFQIKLKKVSDTDKFLQTHKEKPVILLDNQGKELDHIPEPKVNDEDSIDEFLDNAEKKVKVKDDFLNEEVDFEEEIDLDSPRELNGLNLENGEFDITKANLSEVKISDLKELHKKKVEVTRREQIEEQKKIEERNRLIEARKEELRAMKEKESSELDGILGGVELLGKKDFNKLENSEKVEEFDDELI